DGQFEDFVTFEPNRNLPDFAVAGVAGVTGAVSPDSELLRRFRRAHHYGAFFWLVRDRLADDQTAPDRELEQLGDLLFQHWALAMEEAARDVELARAVIGDATARWRVGTADEKRALRDRTITPAYHAATVTRKLDWITSAARMLLAAAGEPERARLFQRAYDCFLLGLQCIDDVSDEAEDRTLRGCSVPEALGCSGGPCCARRPSWCRAPPAWPAKGASRGWRRGCRPSRARSRPGASRAIPSPTRWRRSRSSGRWAPTSTGRRTSPATTSRDRARRDQQHDRGASGARRRASAGGGDAGLRPGAGV